jgi:hypothetical protein
MNNNLLSVAKNDLVSGSGKVVMESRDWVFGLAIKTCVPQTFVKFKVNKW